MGIYIDASAVVKQLTTLSPKTAGFSIPFIFATYMVLFDTFFVLCMFICFSEAHNGKKYVKTLINRA